MKKKKEKKTFDAQEFKLKFIREDTMYTDKLFLQYFVKKQ